MDDEVFAYGEKVEVSDSGNQWCLVKFIADAGKDAPLRYVVCFDIDVFEKFGGCSAWKYCRKSTEQPNAFNFGGGILNCSNCGDPIRENAPRFVICENCRPE